MQVTVEVVLTWTAVLPEPTETTQVVSEVKDMRVLPTKVLVCPSPQRSVASPSRTTNLTAKGPPAVVGVVLVGFVVGVVVVVVGLVLGFVLGFALDEELLEDVVVGFDALVVGLLAVDVVVGAVVVGAVVVGAVVVGAVVVGVVVPSSIPWALVVFPVSAWTFSWVGGAVGVVSVGAGTLGLAIWSPYFVQAT